MATQVSDGVKKEIVKQGDGPAVKKGDKITVHCTGSLPETGKKFWSTKDPGQQPFSFQCGVGQVIAGWDEGCLTMKQGEISKITVDHYKGYGEAGFPAWGIPPRATLQFEIEILSIK